VGASGSAAAASLALCAGLIWIAHFEIDGEIWFSLFDDALISMRYARNLALGQGLVWNPGEPPVEGYTNFLWTLWMALLHRSGASDAGLCLLVRASGALLVALNVLALGAIARRAWPGRPRVERLALWLVALSYPNLAWGVSGLEIPAVALLLSWAVLGALRLREPRARGALGGLCAALALGLLTRSDFLVPGAVVSAFALANAAPGRRRRVAWALGISAVATLAAHTAFRWAYYADPLPNTYTLKLVGTPLDARLLRGLTSFGASVLTCLFLPLACGAAVFLTWSRQGLGAAGLLAGVFAACCLYSIWVGGDAWEFFHYPNRYLAPALPLLLALAAAGIDGIAEAGPRARRGLTLLAIGMLAGLPLLEAALLRVVEQVRFAALGLPLAAKSWQGLREVTAGAAAVATLARVWAVPAALGPGSSPGLEARLRSACVGVLVVATLAMMQADQATRWARGGRIAAASPGPEVVRLALAIREATAPDARVAVVRAGGIPYFSRRPAVDLLGKNDRVIAAGERRDVPLYPGHDKWDYAYSIGTLRPDLIAQLRQISALEFEALRSWGYLPVDPTLERPDLWVRADSARVDLGSLRRWLCGGSRGAGAADAAAVDACVARLAERAARPPGR